MADRTLSVKLVGDSKDLQRALGGASKEADKLGKSSSLGGNAAKKLGLLAGGAALGGVALLGKGLMDGVRTAIEHEKALKQTEAVIKSTSGSAKVTAADVLGLSDKIEKMSGIDDLNVQAGENMLLTFTNIRNEVGAGNKIFDQATTTLADMSVALGTDMSKSAVQLGKALNDPIKGISSLSRVGVTFTQSQKDAIKAMVDTGNTAGAQKIILGELQKEFGGSAAAAGTTFAGQVNILKAHLEDLEQEIGQKVLPVLTSLVDWAIKNWPVFQKHAEDAMQGISNAWIQLKPSIDNMMTTFDKLLTVTKNNWDGPGGLSTIIKSNMSQSAGFVKIGSSAISGDWSGMWDGMKQVAQAQHDLIEAGLRLAIKGMSSAATALGNAIKNGITDAVDGIATAVKGYIGEIPGKLRDLVGGLKSAAGELGGAIVDGIGDGLGSLGATLARLLKAPINAVIDSWNSLSFSIPGFDSHIPGVGKVGGQTVSVPNVPRLAAGGIVKARPGGMLAILGEGGRDEAVIPLSGGAGGGRTVIVNVKVDGWVGSDQEIADRLRNVFIRMGRNTTGFGGVSNASGAFG